MTNTDIDQTIIENPATAKTAEKEKDRDGIHGPQLPFVEQWKEQPQPKGKRKMTSEEKALVRDLLTGTAAGAAVFFAEQNRWWGAFGAHDAGAETPPEQPDEFKAIIKDCAPMAETAGLDNMSYQQAFDAARAEVGAGGFFEWRGQIFNTYTAEEWNGMTAEQHEQFADSIDYQAPAPEPARFEVGGERPSHRHDDPYDGFADNSSGGGIPATNASYEPDEMKPEVEVEAFDVNGNNMPDTFALNADNDNFAEGLIIDKGEQHQNFIMLADENNNNVYDHAYEIDGKGNIQSRKEISEEAGLGASIETVGGEKRLQLHAEENYQMLSEEELNGIEKQPLPDGARPVPDESSPEIQGGDPEIEAEIRDRREIYQTSADEPTSSDSALAQNGDASASDVLMRDAEMDSADHANAVAPGAYSYEMEQTAFDVNSFDNASGGEDSFVHDFA